MVTLEPFTAIIIDAFLHSSPIAYDVVSAAPLSIHEELDETFSYTLDLYL